MSDDATAVAEPTDAPAATPEAPATEAAPAPPEAAPPPQEPQGDSLTMLLITEAKRQARRITELEDRLEQAERRLAAQAKRIAELEAAGEENEYDDE
jgi:hypothetical protein